MPAMRAVAANLFASYIRGVDLPMKSPIRPRQRPLSADEREAIISRLRASLKRPERPPPSASGVEHGQWMEDCWDYWLMRAILEAKPPSEPPEPRRTGPTLRVVLGEI